MASVPIKTALVTGSGKHRIGWHVADALARRGYQLVVHYHTSELEAGQTVAHLQTYGNEAVAVGADLAQEDEVKALIAQTLDRFSRLDVLVNCAATWSRKRLEDVTADDVRGFFEINTLGTFLCSQHAGLAMVCQPDGGSIVTVGDWATERPYLDYAAYFPSKGALPALTRSLAVELGTRNPKVRVNCILPGPVLLPEEMSQRERALSIRGTLLKREGSPDNVAQAVLFFVENNYVTGTCLPVDGGRMIFAPDSAE
jgi:pteridine reductase